MNPIGSIIIIGAIALAGSIVVFKTIQHFNKPRRVLYIDQLTTNEQIIGDGAWIITAAEFPPSGVLREPEPRGM